MSHSSAASSSAIWIVLSAAPFRRLSPETKRARPRPSGTPGSCRMRPTRDSSMPAAAAASGRRPVGRPAQRRGSLWPVGDRQGLGEFGVDRQRVAGEDRDANAGAAHGEVGHAENLAAFVAQLLVLVGLTAVVVDQRTGQRQHVERNGRDVLLRRREGRPRNRRGPAARVVDDRAHLLGQLVHAGQTATGDGLVARHDQALQSGLVVQRLEHRHRGHGGAVRVGDDALGQVAGRPRG